MVAGQAAGASQGVRLPSLAQANARGRRRLGLAASGLLLRARPDIDELLQVLVLDAEARSRPPEHGAAGVRKGALRSSSSA
jgi:hypothetical protein